MTLACLQLCCCWCWCWRSPDFLVVHNSGRSVHTLSCLCGPCNTSTCPQPQSHPSLASDLPPLTPTCRSGQPQYTRAPLGSQPASLVHRQEDPHLAPSLVCTAGPACGARRPAQGQRHVPGRVLCQGARLLRPDQGGCGGCEPRPAGSGRAFPAASRPGVCLALRHYCWGDPGGSLN